MIKSEGSFGHISDDSSQSLLLESRQEVAGDSVLMNMKKVATAILVVLIGVGVCLPANAVPGRNVTAQSRADRKMQKKQAKAMKKYLKAQKKAEQKMIKKDRKNTHLPTHY